MPSLAVGTLGETQLQEEVTFPGFIRTPRARLGTGRFRGAASSNDCGQGTAGMTKERIRARAHKLWKSAGEATCYAELDERRQAPEAETC